MSNLENILSHSDCLTQEQMQLYLENKLEKEEVHGMESHMVDCMFCSDALEGLQLLDADTNQSHISDIRIHITSLINTDDKEEAAISTKADAPTPTNLKASKGGKRISWAAAAGIFFLVFGGGMVVFSYINNNTNWLNKEEQYSKSEKSNSKKDELDYSEKRSPEFENVTIETSGLPEADLAKDKKTSSKKEENIDYKLKDKDAVAINTSNNNAKNRFKRKESEVLEEQNKEILAAPSVPSKPSSKILPKAKKATEKKREAIIAKNDKQPNFGDISTQNTYTQPKYNGKLKDLKSIGNNEDAPTVSKKRKKLGKAKVASTAEGRVGQDYNYIDGIQTKGSKQGMYVVDDFDAYTVGKNAYNKGEYKKSIKYYKKALRKKTLKNRNEVLFQLALAYEQSNNISKAEKIYEQLEKNAAYKNGAIEGLRRVRARRK